MGVALVMCDRKSIPVVFCSAVRLQDDVVGVWIEQYQNKTHRKAKGARAAAAAAAGAAGAAAAAGAAGDAGAAGAAGAAGGVGARLG
ncbi:hypothetical protein AgCh_021526 [Apium graveolens]